MFRKTRVKKQYENKSYHVDETMDLERFVFHAVLSVIQKPNDSIYCPNENIEDIFLIKLQK